jgi:hypothetical protein
MKRLRYLYANLIRPVLLTKTDNASSVLSERRQGPNPVRSRVARAPVITPTTSPLAKRHPQNILRVNHLQT